MLTDFETGNGNDPILAYLDRNLANIFEYHSGKIICNIIERLPYHIKDIKQYEAKIWNNGLKEIGVDFYLIDLDQTDENGNTLEFVFTTSDTTQLRGLQTLTKGEHIRVVCHGPKEYAQRPWEFAFGNVTDETMPAAISVTALP